MLVEELVFLCEGLKFAVNGCDVLQVGYFCGPLPNPCCPNLGDWPDT
jgi:hypothetical protein